MSRFAHTLELGEQTNIAYDCLSGCDLGSGGDAIDEWRYNRSNSPDWPGRWLVDCGFTETHFSRLQMDPQWLTSTVVAVAQGIYVDRAFNRLPILADALQDVGCEHAKILTHCRGPGPHVRGCWVVDLVLGKS